MIPPPRVFSPRRCVRRGMFKEPINSMTRNHVPTETAQTDPLVALRQYDYQNRKALDALTKQIQAAGADRAKLAALETGLIGVLEDPQATLGGKQEACHFLWEIGTGRSVPALAKLLQNPATANMARYALERNTDGAAGAALRSALNTAKGVELVGVINSVGNRGDGQAVAQLRALAAGTDTLTSDAAVIALGKIGTLAAVTALRSLPRPSALVHVAVLQATDRLAASGRRTDALSLYEGMTRPSFSEVVRAGALAGLEGLGAPKTGELALSVARSTQQPTLQRVAGRVLGMQTSSSDLKAALTAWPNLPVPTQVALLAAWGDRRETGAATTAIEALRSPSADVRVAAILTASRIGGVPAVMPLAALAEGGEQARAAREALARMSGPGVEAALLKLASTSPATLQTAIIQVLGERPTTTSTMALLQVAQSTTDARVASAALKVLGRTGAVEQANVLVQVLVKTDSEAVRDAAQGAIVAIALRTGDRDRAAQPLLSAMDQATSSGKIALIGALAEVGGESALAVIVKATSSSDAPLKDAAISSLADVWAEANALPVLLKLAKNEPSKPDRVRALRGYLRLVAANDRIPAQQWLSQVSEALALAERPEEKRQALSVLREIRLPGAVTLAAAALDNPELVAEAADAVLYLAESQKKDRTTFPAVQGSEVSAALEKVIKLTQDESVRVRARKLLQK